MPPAKVASDCTHPFSVTKGTEEAAAWRAVWRAHGTWRRQHVAHGASAIKRELHTQQRGEGVIDSPILGPLQRSSGHSRQKDGDANTKSAEATSENQSGGAQHWARSAELFTSTHQCLITDRGRFRSSSRLRRYLSTLLLLLQQALLALNCFCFLQVQVTAVGFCPFLPPCRGAASAVDLRMCRQRLRRRSPWAPCGH